MLESLGGGDLVAGAVAAAIFLVLVFAFTLSPVVSAALALVAYLGFRLVLPRPDANEPIIRTCARKVDEIGELAKRFDPAQRPLGSGQVRQIYQLLVEILAMIRADRTKRDYAAPFLSDYLTPVSAVLVPYTRLAAKDVESADRDLSDTEKETMPRIVDQLKKLKDDLYLTDVTHLRTGKELVDMMSLPIVSRFDDGNR